MTDASAMNHFQHEWAAARYQIGRPNIHPAIVTRIRHMLNLVDPIPRALDVGCGSGQSTAALRVLATTVVGVDPSGPMLARADRIPGIDYVCARAERLPVADASVDLVTASLAFHWFARTAFLAEARRTLSAAGWLVVYDSAFLGAMRENPAVASWATARYRTRFPSPPRDRRPLTAADATVHGFSLVISEHHAIDQEFSVDELVGYLMTQSNIIAAVVEGRDAEQDVETWLYDEMCPLFIGPRATFGFSGPIVCVQKQQAR